MSKLNLLIIHELKSDLRTKSFWLTTFLTPILMVAFGVVIAFLTEDSETTRNLTNPGAPDVNELSDLQIMGMLSGILLAIFLMIYGGQIFGKVKKEKINRVMEVMATCVPGRTMMLAKIISVGLLGILQLVLWGVIIGAIIIGVTIFSTPNVEQDVSHTPNILLGIIWTLLFFVGGYIFYGSLYAACGAMTDKDNENQGYMTIITFCILGTFYFGEYAVSHPDNPLVTFFGFFPLTSPTIAAVNAVSESWPLWCSILSVVVLYLFAAGSVILSGKIYTSSLLLKGRKFTPKDIMTFLKSK